MVNHRLAKLSTGEIEAVSGELSGQGRVARRDGLSVAAALELGGANHELVTEIGRGARTNTLVDVALDTVAVDSVSVLGGAAKGEALVNVEAVEVVAGASNGLDLVTRVADAAREGLVGGEGQVTRGKAGAGALALTEGELSAVTSEVAGKRHHGVAAVVVALGRILAVAQSSVGIEVEVVTRVAEAPAKGFIGDEVALGTSREVGAVAGALIHDLLNTRSGEGTISNGGGVAAVAFTLLEILEKE